VNAARIVDELTAAALDVRWYVRELAPVSEYGRRAYALIEPYVRGQEREAQERAARIAAFAERLDEQRLDAIRDVLRGVPDALPAIARVALGDILSDADFLIALRFCDAFARLRTLVADAGNAAPSIDDAALRAAADALERGRSGKFGFYLRDALHRGLKSARTAERAAQEAYERDRGRVAAAVGLALQRDDLDGEFIVLRANAPATLPPDVRVIREAPTYLLCEIELDDAALEGLRERDAAAAAVAAVEEEARSALSTALREYSSGMEGGAQWIGELDVLVAAALYTRSNCCTVPQIEDEPIVSFEDARHLPLAQRLAREGRAYAPIAVDLHGVAVLTGPNMGGKSVALRTCGALAFCAAFGLPVPAARARVALFERIAWVGVGAQEPEGGSLLSAFASEVVRLRDLLSADAERMLVLADEFARTTTPQEGRALLVALIERLRALGGCAFIATHLAGVARAAGVRHLAVRGLRGIPRKPDTEDLDRALAALAESMDYTLAEVTDDAAPPADAIALASLLGLDDDLIAAARKAL
jgi:DNA mismatch repair protein MutS2